MSVALIRLPQLINRIGLAKSAIYDRLNKNSPYFDPTFPQPIKLGNGKNPPIAFLSSEVDSWISSRIEFSRQKEARGQ